MAVDTNNQPELLLLALENLQQLIVARSVEEQPPAELLQVEGYVQLYAQILETRQVLMAFASGDLGCKVVKKGYLAGALKTLQASLCHLTWQTQMIASGDFSQRVDFMGEFAESFNSMVEQLAASRQNLETLAHTDPLTGINNRGYFMELLTTELERAKRYERQLSFLMFDLDHFKAINDTHGHAAGDETLRSLCRVFKSSGLRSSDFFGRIGGEEFAIALPETELRMAADVAERIREELLRTAIVYADKTFFVTASIGVSTYRSGDTLETLLSRGDQAMYCAKDSGRNRVRLEN
jgi:diguanylate cyclase (GGDEF)-like protein